MAAGNFLLTARRPTSHIECFIICYRNAVDMAAVTCRLLSTFLSFSHNLRSCLVRVDVIPVNTCSYHKLINLPTHRVSNTKVILRASWVESTQVQSSYVVFCEMLQGTVCIHADKTCKSETRQAKIDLSLTVDVSCVSW